MNKFLVLTVIQKLVLCVGVFISLLLVLYPPWIVTVLEVEIPIPRAFISPAPFLSGAGLKELFGDEFKVDPEWNHDLKFRINRTRQIVDPLLTLAFTLALLWALKAPAIGREGEDNA